MTFGASARPQRVLLIGNQDWANNSSSALILSNITNGAAVPILGNNSLVAPMTLTFNGSGSGNTNMNILIQDNTASDIAGALSMVVNTSGAGITSFGNSLNTFSGGVQISGGIAAATSGTSAVSATNGALGRGATLINGGQLNSTAANALLGSSTVTMSSGELRATVAGSLATAAPVTLSGGTLRGFAAATTDFGGTTFNVTGNTSVINDRSASGAGGVNHTFGSALSVAGSQLNVTSANYDSGTATVTFGAATLTGNAAINVTNTAASTILGLTTLGVTGSGNSIAAGSGAVSVSGATTIGGGSSGSLFVNGILNATGGLSVEANGTLGGSGGTIAGAVTTASSTSVIAPGSSAGTLTLSDTLDTTAGANFKFELGSTSGSPNSDLLSIGGVFTGSSAAGGLVFDFTSIGLGTATGTPYTLMTFVSSTGFDRSDIFTNTLPTGLILDTNFGDNGYALNSGDLQVQFAVIPEPSTFAVLVGGVVILGGLQRVRRRTSKGCATGPLTNK